MKVAFEVEYMHIIYVLWLGTYIIRRRGSIENSGGRYPERLLLSISLLTKISIITKTLLCYSQASAEIKVILEVTKMCFTQSSTEIMHVYWRRETKKLTCEAEWTNWIARAGFVQSVCCCWSGCRHMIYHIRLQR